MELTWQIAVIWIGVALLAAVLFVSISWGH